MPSDSAIDFDVLWAEAQDLAEDLIDKGADEEEAVESVAEFLDAVVPLDKFVPGLPGVFLEANDKFLFETLIKLLREHVKIDPEQREARKAARQARRAVRRAKRLSRRS